MTCGMGPLPEEQAAAKTTSISSDESLFEKMMCNIWTGCGCCTFSFGIDTSAEGLSNGFVGTRQNYYPLGIKAVEMTANIRTQHL